MKRLNENKIAVEFRLFFQRRSGGHAIVEWIASHFDGKGILINSLRPNVKWNKPTKYWNIEYPFHGANSEMELRKHEKGKLKINHEFIITTYEDPLRYADHLYRSRINGVNTNKIKKIIVNRDIYNHIASRLKFDHRRKNAGPPGWYDKCIIDWEKLVTISDSNPYIEINYNKWIKNKKYRIEIGKSLCLPNNDGHKLNTIPNYGGGSSFTGIKENANIKKLNSRWKTYINEFGITQEFQKVLNSNSLREINLSKFGWALNKKGELILR